tara:strand:- start:343 stop:693 length:351 start_codon:yes stop_codon:yes gene_type:complete
MKTITLLIFKLMLDAGVVVPMNQDNEGRELYTLFPNANSVAFDGVGLTILDLQEEGVEGATENFAFMYLDEGLRLQGVSNEERAFMFDYCYKGEILNWIQTMEFQYNEAYSDDLNN